MMWVQQRRSAVRVRSLSLPLTPQRDRICAPPLRRYRPHPKKSAQERVAQEGVAGAWHAEREGKRGAIWDESADGARGTEEGQGGCMLELERARDCIHQASRLTAFAHRQRCRWSPVWRSPGRAWTTASCRSCIMDMAVHDYALRTPVHIEMCDPVEHLTCYSVLKGTVRVYCGVRCPVTPVIYMNI